MHFIDTFQIVSVVVGMNILPNHIWSFDGCLGVELNKILQRQEPILIRIVSIIRILDT